MPKAYAQPGPVARALELVGERWTLLVLQELLRGRHRFAQLTDSVQGIAPNVLSERLKSLESYGVVERMFYSDHPPRAEYHLTRMGHELGVVAGALAAWGAKYLSDDIVLVHAECGSRVQVVYYCPGCDAQVKGAAVRLVDRTGSAEVQEREGATARRR